MFQGLITNDVEQLKQDAHPVLYAAILNAQGRQLHDIFLHRDPSMNLEPSEAAFRQALLDCPLHHVMIMLLCHSISLICSRVPQSDS